MKNKVEFERILDLALLKFGKLDSADITLIMQDIDKVFEVEIDKENIDRYFVMGNGNIVLDDNYINSTLRDINYFKLERNVVNMLDRYLNNMDVEMFVLRKIKLLGLGSIPRDDLIHNFSVIQLQALWNLYRNGDVIDYLQEDMVNGNYQAIKLSKSGMVKLFVKENYMMVRQFYRTLINLKADASKIKDYFMNVDLDGDILEILDVDRYLEFCENSKKDIDEYKNNRNVYCKNLINGCQ